MIQATLHLFAVAASIVSPAPCWVLQGVPEYTVRERLLMKTRACQNTYCVSDSILACKRCMPFHVRFARALQRPLTLR
jgi:hypothetical protein